MWRGMALVALAATAAVGQTVEGTVSNSLGGAPLAGVRVSLESGGKLVRNAVTDGQGMFRIEGLAPGNYQANFSLEGFEGPPASDPARHGFGLTAAVPVRLEILLTPLAKLSGRVLDPADAPVSGARVWLFGSHVGYDATTSGQGRFSYDRISPDTYLLFARAPAHLGPPAARDGERLGWVMTFFPGVPDMNAATRVVIRPGMELWDQDIRLQVARVHSIRGRVLDPSGAPAPHVRVTLSYTNILQLEKDLESIAASGDDGVFEFPSAVSGTWQLTAQTESGGEKLRAFAKAAVTGADLDHVDLRLSPPFAVTGTMARQAPGDIRPRQSTLMVMLVPEGGGGVFHQGKVDAEGHFQIEGVYPGRYTVRTVGSSAPYYLDSVRLGERDILGVEPVEIISDALPLTFKFRADGGTVHGTVEDCGSATIRLIPQDPNLRLNELIRTARCTENNRYEIANIRPGEYYALALDRSPGLQDMFFGFDVDQDLINQSVSVTVRRSETTDADLRVVSRP